MPFSFCHVHSEKYIFPSNTINYILGPLAKQNKAVVKNLDVLFVSEFKFDKQINLVAKKEIIINLRLLAKMKPLLSFRDLEIVNNAFFAHLDYCNSLYMGVGQKALVRIQAVQNAPERLLTGTRKRDHTTLIQSYLKWSPVCLQIE